jgi:hypothetical protein
MTKISNPTVVDDFLPVTKTSLTTKQWCLKKWFDPWKFPSASRALESPTWKTGMMPRIP